MATSYFDLGTVQLPTVQEIQQSGQDALATAAPNAQGVQLAVRPRLDLRAALTRALQRQEATSALGIGEQRLGLQQEQTGLEQGRGRLEQARIGQRLNQLSYEQGQLPYTIGLGALSGGLGIYRGYKALQKEDLDAARTQQAIAAQQATERQLTESTARQVSLLQAIKRQQDLVGLDPSATTHSLTGL